MNMNQRKKALKRSARELVHNKNDKNYYEKALDETTKAKEKLEDMLDKLQNTRGNILDESKEIRKKIEESLSDSSSLPFISDEFSERMKKIDNEYKANVKKIEEDFAARKAKREAEWEKFDKSWQEKKAAIEKKFDEMTAKNEERLNKLVDMQDKLLSGEMSLDQAAKELGIDITTFFDRGNNWEDISKGISKKDIESIESKIRKLH